jgi:hypothetical protein
MSWVATGTAAIGAVGSIGGGLAGGGGPAGPAISSNSTETKFGSQTFGAQKDHSAVVIAIVIAVAAVVLGGLFLIARNRRKASANG